MKMFDGVPPWLTCTSPLFQSNHIDWRYVVCYDGTYAAGGQLSCCQLAWLWCLVARCKVEMVNLILQCLCPNPKQTGVNIQTSLPLMGTMEDAPNGKETTGVQGWSTVHHLHPNFMALVSSYSAAMLSPVHILATLLWSLDMSLSATQTTFPDPG